MSSIYQDIVTQLKNLSKKTKVLCCLGEPNGIATLGPDGIVPDDQLPPGGGGGGSITADNALNMSTATNIQLGGSLIQNTLVSQSTNILTFSGSGTNTLEIDNTSDFGIVVNMVYNGLGAGGMFLQSSGDSAYGIYSNMLGASSTGLIGLGSSAGGLFQGTTDASIGVKSFGLGIGSVGVNGISNENSLPGLFKIVGTTLNNTLSILQLHRDSPSGAPTAGVGGSMDFLNPDTNNTAFTSNRIISQLTSVSVGAVTSNLTITGINVGTPTNLLILKGNGVVNIPTALGNFANNAAAITGGLVAGDIYRNGDVLMIVH